MPYVLLDDAFPDHPKVEKLSDPAFRLHVAGMCYAGRLLTDGHITLERVKRLVVRFRAKALAELLDEEIWHPHGATCGSPVCQPALRGGIYIHDFLAINRSKAKADAGREAAAARQRRYRTRHASGDDVSNGVTDGVSDAAQAKPSQAEGSPQPPAERGAPEAAGDPPASLADRIHTGQHSNCRACGTNRRPLATRPIPPLDRPPVPDWIPPDPIDRAPMPPNLRALIRKETA